MFASLAAAPLTGAAAAADAGAEDLRAFDAFDTVAVGAAVTLVCGAPFLEGESGAVAGEEDEGAGEDAGTIEVERLPGDDETVSLAVDPPPTAEGTGVTPTSCASSLRTAASVEAEFTDGDGPLSVPVSCSSAAN